MHNPKQSKRRNKKRGKSSRGPRKSTQGRSGRKGGIQGDVVVYRPSLYAQPLPRRYRVTFNCEADYKIPIATAAITLGSVKANSLFAPFRPGGSSAFPSFTFLGPATETSLRPTGLTDIVQSNLYGLIKVLRSRIAVRWAGSNSGNNVLCTLVPTLNTQVPSTVYQARTCPFARQCSFSVSKPNTGANRDGWLVQSINPMTIYGLNALEFKADIQANVSTGGADPAIQIWWNVFLQSNDEDVSATTASTLQVRLSWDVELFALANMALS